MPTRRRSWPCTRSGWTWPAAGGWRPRTCSTPARWAKWLRTWSDGGRVANDCPVCYDAKRRPPGGPARSTAATVELPPIEKLTAEQKRQLLALLIKDELDRQPVPMPIIVRHEGEELGHFRPKITPPAKTTPY